MLKQVTVNIIVDDHEPEKCGDDCPRLSYDQCHCSLFDINIGQKERCKQCLEEAK